MDRLDEFLEYHDVSYRMGDIDPSYDMLRYVCDRFDMNLEQRYWLSFLYACTYNAATVYYIYNEFPDYLGVNVGRLERWWYANRDRLSFQTDCRWIRSRNQFVDIYVSYRNLVGESQQVAYLSNATGATSKQRYAALYAFTEQIRYFGRFRLFLLLEAVHVVAGVDIYPDSLPLEQAQSSRNGIAYAFGKDDLLCGHDYGRTTISKDEMQGLYKDFDFLLEKIKKNHPEQRVDAWNVETTLCAYKKWHRGKRWPGYYLTRQAKEISQMQSNVPEGVCWDVLWDYRKENLQHQYLCEFTGKEDPKVFGGHEENQLSMF